MELLSAIAGALIGGGFTLLGAWLASSSGRKQMDMQQRFQGEERLRKDRIELYTQIMGWLQKIQLAFEYLAQAGDMKGFTETVHGSCDSFERLAPHLELMSSTMVYEMFQRTNESLGAFFKALHEGETHGEALGKLAAEADSCVRDTARKLKKAMRQEIGVHD